MNGGRIWIERPLATTRRRFTVDEASAFLNSWYRVVDGRGSTIAYCPDAETADLIRAAVRVKQEEC